MSRVSVRLLSGASTVALALSLSGCNSSSPATPSNPPVAAAPSPTPEPTPEARPEPTPEPAAEGPGPIAYVRVGFYGIQCPHGRKPPNNNHKQLPVGCIGFVTATPKKADGTDVKPRDHGPDIAWELIQGEIQVKVIEDESQAFNKQLKGRVPGAFSLCATVRTVQGCLNGDVIP